MIRINLLPEKASQKRAIPAGKGVLLAIPLVTLALLAGIFLKNGRDIVRLRAEEAALAQQRASVNRVFGEFAAIEGQRKEMAQRIAVIDRIVQGRGLVPRMLYDLSSLATDRLWITRLRKNEAKLDLEGRSVDNESICTFVEALSGLQYMKNVELVSVEDVADAGLTVKKFLVQGSVAS